ncbi:hypothetical protein BDV24DRAFT_138696 [Aspergillus arachidicola]|uniref:Uncharacterized protein n=1 Tax=Aspergillus arachidicola TaxID=656916 RepID=A0A5N6Y398_9EURO|nr:hypothetical protein BDV24DRAFT_138696 [Aspergillus arachidicola]
MVMDGCSTSKFIGCVRNRPTLNTRRLGLYGLIGLINCCCNAWLYQACSMLLAFFESDRPFPVSTTLGLLNSSPICGATLCCR